MKKTGLLYDERYLNHNTGPYHPECQQRLKVIIEGLKEAGFLSKLTMICAKTPDMKWIEAVHDIKYIKRFKELCISGIKTFDYPDNQMCTETYEIALLAVGGTLEAVRLVMEGEINNAFCAIRPPGHHAEYDRAMGFCYFNNAAIAANYLLKEWDIKRVGIIDFDVHHGNGTQHIFEENPSVFYYSIHEHPSFAFPGTGRVFEKGTGLGSGFTRNYPVLPGQGDSEYKKIVSTDLLPAFEEFKPEVILVSTGFDAHIEDAMSGIKVTTDCFSWIMKKIVKLADTYCKGKIISILEGGYCLKRLPELVINHIKILLDDSLNNQIK